MIEEIYWNTETGRVDRRVVSVGEMRVAVYLADNLSDSTPLEKPVCFYCGNMICDHEQPEEVRKAKEKESTLLSTSSSIPLTMPSWLAKQQKWRDKE